MVPGGEFVDRTESKAVADVATRASLGGEIVVAYNQIVGQAGGSGAKIAPGNFCDCDFDEVCAC